MVDISSMTTRKQETPASAPVLRDEVVAEELPRLKHVLNLLERNGQTASAPSQKTSAGQRIGRRLKKELQPRLAARLAQGLHRQDTFNRGEQWLVGSLFSRPDAATKRSLQDMLWVAAHRLERDGRVAEALHIYHALLAHAEPGEAELVQMLLAGLTAGDDALSDLCIDRMVASAAREDAPPPPERSDPRFARATNSVLKALRGRGDLDRAETFIFDYVARFDDLVAYWPIYLNLRRFARIMSKEGRSATALRLRRILADAGGRIVLSSYLAPQVSGAGDSHGILPAGLGGFGDWWRGFGGGWRNEFRLVKALYIGADSGNAALVDACLKRLSAVSPTEDRPLPSGISKERLAGAAKAIIKQFRYTGDLARAETVVFDYLTKFKEFTSLPTIAPVLRKLARDFHEAGRSAAARKLYMRLVKDGYAGLEPQLLPLQDAVADRRLLDAVIARTLAPDSQEAADVDQSLGILLRQMSSLKPDELDAVADAVNTRVAALAASAPEGLAKTSESILTICRALIKANRLGAAKALAETLAEKTSETADLVLVRAHIEKWTWNLEEARNLYRRALALPDCDPSAHFELAETLEFLGDDPGAIAEVETGLSLFDEDELFLKNAGALGMRTGPRMRQGDLVAGWESYQRRVDRRVLEAPPGTSIWEGERLSDERLLLLAEKGVGDEIRYASCYSDLLERAPNVGVSCDPRLAPLLQRSFPSITFIPASRGGAQRWKRKTIERDSFKLSRALTLEMYCLAIQFDRLAMAGDLPFYLRRSRDAFPRRSGYLIPDTARRERWRSRLAELGPGLKVGLSWRSASMGYKRQQQHYFRIEEMLPVLAVKGVHFVNLQYDDCQEELAWLEHEHGIVMHRWDDVDLKDDLEDVAALMKELDLVVAPHTMVKEMAGAVGAPALFMAPTGQAWVRWRADPQTGADIWHPSLTHIQSARAGDKQDVVRQTQARLEDLVAERGCPPDWTPATSGRHGDARTQDATDTADAAAESEPIVNAYGETYIPAPADAFADRDARDAEWSRREAAFESACAQLFDGSAQPANPKGVLLTCNMGSYKQNALMALGAHGLLTHDWAVIPLDKSPFEPGRPQDEGLSYFRDLLLAPAGGKRLYCHRNIAGGSLRFDWEIDWENRICRAEGINFYGVIANRLGKEFRRYTVDTNEPKVARRLEIHVMTCDAALAVCIDAEKRLAARGLPVRITGFEPNYPPAAVFKVYCGERGHQHGIDFFEIRQGYEKYFRAGRSGLVTAIDAQNVTRNNLYSAGSIRPDQFEAWLRENGDDPAVAARAEGWVKQDRSGHGKPTPEGEIVLDRIRRHKAAGGKVACLFGCIPFDFGHPWLDEGPAHRDLKDWYNHTVATLNGSDVLLLVKPHPSEADFEQFGYPDEFFVEMLGVTPEHNVSLLGHRWLNNADLIPHLDFGITWRGTIGTELGLMGVPVVACGRYFMTDGVLDFPAPTSREDYEDMLRNADRRLKLPPGLKERAAMIFEFYRTEMMIDYPFGWIPAKRNEMGPPALSEAAIADYLANGHASVDEIVKRITE